tara:strand:+ start:4484 stop:5404 length:921 start_codon:yes stop_codon:yes gene_type:complete
MNLMTKQLKHIIAEELRSVLKEQNLFSYLTGIGMSEDDIMDIMEKPGGTKLLNLFREFEFKKLPNKDFPQWQRATGDYHYTENGPTEIQTISDYGKYGIELKRHGPRWEARTGAQQRGYQTDWWDDYEAATEGITELITPVASTMALKENRSHGLKIADMIMAALGQDAAHFIQMGIVPMEEIVAGVVEMATPVYQNLSALKNKHSKLYSDLADYQRMGDYSMSDKLSWDINSVEKQIRQAAQPLNNIYNFWKSADVDGDHDYLDKVDMLLQSKELRNMIPGFRHAWAGNHDYDPDNYGIIEHEKG